MAATILYKERQAQVAGAVGDGNDLWIPLDDLEPATGWRLKPEGACLGDVCVPIPAGREREFLRAGGRFNLAALARLLGQPIRPASSIHTALLTLRLFDEARRLQPPVPSSGPPWTPSATRPTTPPWTWKACPLDRAPGPDRRSARLRAPAQPRVVLPAASRSPATPSRSACE